MDSRKREFYVKKSQSETKLFKEYAIFLQGFQSELTDQSNSEARLKELYNSRAPVLPDQNKSSLQYYMRKNDVENMTLRQTEEVDRAARKVQRWFRAQRTRRKWRTIIHNMVAVQSAEDPDETRLISTKVIDSLARSRQLTGASGGALTQKRSQHQPLKDQSDGFLTVDERVENYRRQKIKLQYDTPEMMWM